VEKPFQQMVPRDRNSEEFGGLARVVSFVEDVDREIVCSSRSSELQVLELVIIGLYCDDLGIVTYVVIAMPVPSVWDILTRACGPSSNETPTIRPGVIGKMKLD
jgi:hypothetical protein